MTGTTRAERRTDAQRAPVEVDPKLRAISQQILSMPVDSRLRQLEAEANLFANIRPIDGP